MTITKILTAAIIAMSASTSLATTKCDHKGTSSLFANTNPPAVVKTVAQTASATTQVGVR